MATVFSAEVLASGDVVVFFLGDWVVAGGFNVVVAFSSTKGCASVDDVIAIMLIGCDVVIKSASWDEDKIRVDFTIFISFKAVGFRVWDDGKSFIDLDDVITEVIRDDVMSFSADEDRDMDTFISLIVICDDNMAVMICDDERFEDDIMGLVACSDVKTSKCCDEYPDPVEVLAGEDIRVSDDVSSCDDVTNFVGDSEVMWCRSTAVDTKAKTLDVVIFFLVSDCFDWEKVTEGDFSSLVRTRDAFISADKDVVVSPLFGEGKICFVGDEEMVELISCLLRVDDASICKVCEDLNAYLVTDDVEGLDFSLGVTCGASSVGLDDVINSTIGDDVTAGCDVILGVVVELVSVCKGSTSSVSE